MKTRESIKEQFLNETIEYGKALAIGDSKKVNKTHKRMHNLYDQAKEINQVDLFSELLNHENENVKLWAATFSLTTVPTTAKKTLIDISMLPSITGLSAKTTLHLWEEGKLNLL
jgi:hypothetical protein